MLGLAILPYSAENKYTKGGYAIQNLRYVYVTKVLQREANTALLAVCPPPHIWCPNREK